MIDIIDISYKGISGYTTYGVIIKSVRRLLPAMRKRELVIPGKDGIYDFGENDSENCIVTVEMIIPDISLPNLRLKARQVAAWLRSKTYEPLILSDEPDKYYKAKIYNESKLQTLGIIGQASITFECQPMAQYIVSTGEDIDLDSDLPLDSDILLDPIDAFTFDVVTSPTAINFENWGTVDINYRSQPGTLSKIIITGSFTTFSITINGATLNYTEAVAGGVVTIDNINCTVKLGDVNKLSAVTGDLTKFLKLIPEINNAIITGTGLNCSVLFDFAPLYI
jgi:predicted phage tail component-like protein